MPSFKHAISSLFGQQRQETESEYFTTYDNLWDVHKSGYDEVSLKLLIEKYGYRNFVRKSNRPWHLDVTFYK
jgi:hypothetical protein